MIDPLQRNIMNITDKLQALRDHKGAHVEIGRSFFLGSKGWLSIDDKDTHFAVMYTSDKDTHGPPVRPRLYAGDQQTNRRTAGNRRAFGRVEKCAEHVAGARCG